MVYCDYSATTPIGGEVLSSMMPFLTSSFGNPSSHYSIGYKAHTAVENSREIIANMIGANADEIFFTSGGSEANTWGCRGFVKNFNSMLYGEALCSPIEHHSVLNAMKGAEFVDVDKFGVVSVEDAMDKIKDGSYSILATMLVNNEIGTIEPIEELSQLCAREGVFFHVDAVQAFGHIPFNVHDKDMEGITTLSMSGHKIGAPKGIGALYIKKEVQDLYQPLICGGQQERGLRGGTENVASIVGFARAAELAKHDMRNYLKIRSTTLYAWDFIKDNIPNVHLNGLPIMDKNRISNNLNVSFEGIQGEALVELLNEQGICVSTGSACNSESEEPSHVLKAIGLSDELANGSLRMSFSTDTKLVEVNELCQKLVEDVEILRG